MVFPAQGDIFLAVHVFHVSPCLMALRKDEAKTFCSCLLEFALPLALGCGLGFSLTSLAVTVTVKGETSFNLL